MAGGARFQQGEKVLQACRCEPLKVSKEPPIRNEGVIAKKGPQTCLRQVMATSGFQDGVVRGWELRG